MPKPIPPISDLPPPLLYPVRVLLVEDNVAAAESLAHLLRSRGFVVTTVSSGTSAIERLRSDPPPEFVLTDLQLPDLDGREIARHTQSLDPRPRVLLISGWDLDGATASPETYGFDAVFLKPIDFRELLELLHSMLLENAPGEESA